VGEGTRRLSKFQDEEPNGNCTWCFRYESHTRCNRLNVAVTVEPRSMHVEVPVSNRSLISLFSSKLQKFQPDGTDIALYYLLSHALHFSGAYHTHHQELSTLYSQTSGVDETVETCRACDNK
jgi:hypothetical protein